MQLNLDRWTLSSNKDTVVLRLIFISTHTHTHKHTHTHTHITDKQRNVTLKGNYVRSTYKAFTVSPVMWSRI